MRGTGRVVSDVQGILEAEGVFEVPIPVGWSVTGEPGQWYDLSHDNLDVGVNISVYGRASTDQDIRATLRAFATSTGVQDAADLDVVVTDEDRSQTRAFLRFSVDDRDWLAAFLWLGHAAVLATSNARAGDREAFAAGELVVASLGPAGKKRSLFRRR
jgi:hypothetical protein